MAGSMLALDIAAAKAAVSATAWYVRAIPRPGLHNVPPRYSGSTGRSVSP